MRLAIAKLKKHKTEDGLCEVFSTIPIGKEYKIDMDSIQEQKMWNVTHNVQHTKEIVWDRSGNNWLPTELLEMPNEN
jgi:hypothetical protein